MSPDREDLQREIAATTDHPKAFAKAILDYTPTIAKRGSEIVLVFDIPEQAADAHDLLWHAINSIKPAVEEEE